MLSGRVSNTDTMLRAALIGFSSTGKTTLCRNVVQDLGRETHSAQVPDPFASREDLLKMLLIDFGVLSIQELTGGFGAHSVLECVGHGQSLETVRRTGLRGWGAAAAPAGGRRSCRTCRCADHP